MVDKKERIKKKKSISKEYVTSSQFSLSVQVYFSSKLSLMATHLPGFKLPILAVGAPFL